MNRKEYKHARRLLRDNGNYAMRWISADAKAAMLKLQAQKTDELEERAKMAAYYRRHGDTFTVKTLQLVSYGA